LSSFGEKLKRLREDNGETQEDIARLLSISRTSISKYESGDREPDIETIKILSKHYRVSVDYIFGLNDIQKFSSYTQELSGANSRPDGSIFAESPFSSFTKDELQTFMKDEKFVRLAKKIREHKLDIGLIEKLIDNVILLNKG
jgi:transcriptional regulator with XRE-family HTH domain